jgi:hypothetical protein
VISQSISGAAPGAGDRHRHDVCIGACFLMLVLTLQRVCVACVGSLRNFYFSPQRKAVMFFVSQENNELAETYSTNLMLDWSQKKKNYD